MRRALDWLYRGSGALAACFLVGICGIVLLQVGANVIDRIAALTTGEAIGLVIPSYAEFAGFFLAAASFFALAHTFRSGSHIRVNLLIQHTGRRSRRWIELWCVGLAGAITGYFCLFMILLVFESVEFGDVSPGMVPVPLWLPQSAMALGLLIMTIGLVDEFFCILTGHRPSYEGAGDALLGGEAGPPSGQDGED